MKKAATDAGEGKNDPGTRWQRTGFYAGRLVEGGGAGTNDDGGQGEPEEEQDGITGKEGTDKLDQKRKHNAKVNQKQMDAKYWLEMVDTKHRQSSPPPAVAETDGLAGYASNLNTYRASVAAAMKTSR